MTKESQQSTVMLVDDTPANLGLLQEILRKAGYRVVAFPEGKAALKAAAKKPPDIILLDILMPGMNGFEVCKRLKEDPVLREIPVLFLSALSEEAEKVKAFEAGGVDYVTKPFQAEEVLARLHTHLRLHRLTRQLETMVDERTAQLAITNEALKQEIVIRKEAEKHLSASQAMLQSVFEGISEPLVLMDRDMRVKLMNKRAAEYYSAIGKPAVPGERLTPEKADAEPADRRGPGLAEAISKGDYQVYERQGLADPERLEQVFVYPVEENECRTGDMIVRIMDVTDDRQLRQEMAQADKLIALGTLVAGVAHEINNPNHIILLNMPILTDVWKSITPILEEYYQANGDFPVGAMSYSEIKPEVPQLIAETASSADRIKRIVSVLKKYSAKGGKSTDGGKNTPLPIDMNEAVRNAVLMLKHKIKNATGGFKVTYGEGLPAVMADQQKLEQVFVNLISNALEALPDNHKGVFVKSYSDPKRQRVLVDVSDEGEGIPEDELTRIMDPFYTTKRAQGGTGLGLAIVQQIIFYHGGSLEVKSREGEGSTFRVIFPTKTHTATAHPVRAQNDANGGNQ